MDQATAGRKVALINVGQSNIARIKRALGRLGHQPFVATTAAQVAEAPLAVLSASGEWGPALDALYKSGLAEGLQAREKAGLPTLGIDLGFHLLCTSRPSPLTGRAGLGLLPGAIRPLPDQGVRGELLHRPHVGWGEVKADRANSLMAGTEAFYFAHEHVVDVGSDWGDCVLGATEHTLLIPAAVASGSTVGVQFLPEMSGMAGLSFLDAFCKLSGNVLG